MQLLLVLGSAASSLIVFVAIALFRSYSSKSGSVPGPWITRFTKLWYLNGVRSGSFHKTNIALHEKYGHVVRVAPGWYSINRPEKIVYGIGSKFRKSDWYEGWKHPSPARWNMFADQDVKRHAETRKKFQSLYTMSSLVSYEHYVDQCNDLLIDRLSRFSMSGETIDMAHWFQCYAFDVMGDITYSARFGFLDQGDDIGAMMAALDRSMVYSTLMGVYAWAHPYLYAIMQNIPGSGAAGRNYLMEFVSGKIAARQKERAKRKSEKPPGQARDDEEQGLTRDFLDRLSDAHDQDPEKTTAYHIFMMGMSNIIAGSDTTAVSLSGALFHLITNPRALATLRAEVDSAERTNGRITYKVASSMKYLQAIIKEALRVYPATGLPLWRVVPEGGAVIAGQEFEVGDIIGLNSWVAHADKSIFGDDAHLFRPERWIEAESENPERHRQMEAYYMPFGLGSRTCIGRHIATLEMSKVLPQLISRFDFELMMPESEWKLVNYWFVKPERFPVRIKPRAS